MANYNKSFNFKNGVQVDNDNFIVNANGLVGIGTLIPSELLDVRGTIKSTGIVTTKDLYVTGIATCNQISLGSAITLHGSTGIITASYYYGNGATLSNLPTSQWTDINVGLGFTSIYNAGYVGVSTNDPRYNFQVGGNPNTQFGVGINSTGDIKATGIITAGSFSGSGSNITEINASNITAGTLSNSRLPSNISVGIITATTNFSGTLVGIASTALSLSGSPNITVTNITSSNINNSASGIITSGNITSGIASVGILTAFTRFYAESIGVGTNSPQSDIHIRRTLQSKLQVTSDSEEAIVAFGRSTTLAENNAALRFGNTSSFQRYSNTKTLDIINYSTGSVNNYLHLGSAGINTGSFNWIYGQKTPNTPLMTLTYDGNLGIGITAPVEKLSVSGDVRVTNLYVDQSIADVVNITATGDISALNAEINNIATINRLTVNNNTTLNGHLEITSLNQQAGISTFNNLKVLNSLNVNNDVTAARLFGEGVIPLGGIIMWSGTIASIPSGWALCNGSNGTPDLRNRFIVGAHSGAGIGTISTSGPGFNVDNGTLNANYTPGNAGGETAHQLTIAELAAHTHTGSALYPGPGAEQNQQGGAEDSTSFNINSGSTGSNKFHENRPPYYALAFIMRIVDTGE